MLLVRPVPAFDDNYIWLIGRQGSTTVVIVDPGDEEPVIEAVEHEDLHPAAILVTHHHRDHTGGIEVLAARYKMPVYGPAQEKIPGLTHPLHGGEVVQLEELALRLQVLATPGHTLGHLCYYGEGALFCGDTLFTAGSGRLFEGTPQQMYASLSAIATLPDDTQVYCAHEYTLANLRFARVAEPGNQAIAERYRATEAARAAGQPTVPASLALEKATNPFLRTAIPELIVGAERFSGHALHTGAEMLAAVRRWKDSLD